MAQAADGALHVHVVTPKGPVAETASDSVIAPGELGQFEVLPGHVPFLTKLHPGVLVLRERGQKKVLAVASGFLSVTAAGEVQVLVEQAAPKEAIDRAGAEKTVQELGPKIREWKSDLDSEYKNLKARLEWAEAQLAALAA